MNSETTIDWESWEVEEPPPDFADRVMDAVWAEPRASGAALRAARSKRWMGTAAGVAMAMGSLTVLAMFGRTERVAQPLPDPKPISNEDRPSLPKSTNAAEVATATARVPRANYAAGTIVDRQRRDAVRAQVVPPLVAQGVEHDPRTGLTIPAGASGPSHNLSKEYIRDRIHEDFFPLARACYEGALAKEPTLRGRIVVDFMIVGDAKSGGIVDQAKINERTDIKDAEFTTCMRESMLSMVFAPPANDGWVTVTYPFVFSPDDDEEAARDR
jgi:hypothetical protein